MLKDIRVLVNTNYFENKSWWDSLGHKVVFTGKIDEFFDYEFGELQYRTLKFENTHYYQENYQGIAIMMKPIIQSIANTVTNPRHLIM